MLVTSLSSIAIFSGLSAGYLILKNLLTNEEVNEGRALDDQLIQPVFAELCRSITKSSDTGQNDLIRLRDDLGIATENSLRADSPER